MHYYSLSIADRFSFFFVLRSNLGDDSKGYFIQPTVILTKDAKSITIVDEIFGPVVTVRLTIYIPFST